MTSFFLDRLKIKNFRNLEYDMITFDSGINCIFGENGNGKTNLLEAIYLITEGKSFRKNTSFPQIINMNGEEPEILFQTKFTNGLRTNQTYSGRLLVQKNEYFLNGKMVKGSFHVSSIFINPFDSLFFHSIPSFRRQWFDKKLSTIDPAYSKNLKYYNQALRMRNSLLLKRSALYLDQIKVIDLEMAKYSFLLVHRRVQFIRELEQFFMGTFNQLFSESHEIRIKMLAKFASLSTEQIYSFLCIALREDQVLGRTKYGVHRDDYMLLFDGLNAFEICSLGQQKMSFLGLSFAYIELFKYKVGTYPIVLIDDVSGELDRKRWNNLIRYICAKEFQVFVTTANEDFRMEFERIEGVRKLHIHKGRVLIH